MAAPMRPNRFGLGVFYSRSYAYPVFFRDKTSLFKSGVKLKIGKMEL